MSNVEDRAVPTWIFPGEDPMVVAEWEKRVAVCLARLDRSPIRRDVDEDGRLLPVSDEALARRRVKLLAMFQEWEDRPGDDRPDAHESPARD